MEDYYKEVRCLEDNFCGLELNHITRRYNEAAEELAKIVSNRTTVPPDVFLRDLHEPFVNLGTTEGVDGLMLDPLPETEAPLTGADVMQTEGSPPPVDLESDWRIPYLDCLIRGDLPSNKTEDRRIACQTKTFVIYDSDKEPY
jgi:hypothetical protein